MTVEELVREFEAYRKKADGWRRQYGAADKRERVLKQRVKELEEENERLRTLLAGRYDGGGE